MLAINLCHEQRTGIENECRPPSLGRTLDAPSIAGLAAEIESKRDSACVRLVDVSFEFQTMLATEATLVSAAGRFVENVREAQIRQKRCRREAKKDLSVATVPD